MRQRGTDLEEAFLEYWECHGQFRDLGFDVWTCGYWREQ